MDNSQLAVLLLHLNLHRKIFDGIIELQSLVGQLTRTLNELQIVLNKAKQRKNVYLKLKFCNLFYFMIKYIYSNVQN